MVIADHPLEAARLAIADMQRRLRYIEAVQVANEPLKTGMQRIIERGPIELLAIMAPFTFLRKFPSHE